MAQRGGGGGGGGEELQLWGGNAGAHNLCMPPECLVSNMVQATKPQKLPEKSSFGNSIVSTSIIVKDVFKYGRGHN